MLLLAFLLGTLIILPSSIKKFLLPIFGPFYSNHALWVLYSCCCVLILPLLRAHFSSSFNYQMSNDNGHDSVNFLSLLVSVWFYLIPLLSDTLFRFADVLPPLYASNILACCLFLVPVLAAAKISLSFLVYQQPKQESRNCAKSTAFQYKDKPLQRTQRRLHIVSFVLGVIVGQLCLYFVLLPRCGVFLIWAILFSLAFGVSEGRKRLSKSAYFGLIVAAVLAVVLVRLKTDFKRILGLATCSSLLSCSFAQFCIL